MKAILINTLEKTVTEIEMRDSIQDMYKLIGCETFCTVPIRLPDKDVLYVDDEGLYHTNKGWFRIFNYPQPLSGNGLIMGVDAKGNSRNVRVNVETIRSVVKFVEPTEIPNPKLKFYFPSDDETNEEL